MCWRPYSLQMRKACRDFDSDDGAQDRHGGQWLWETHQAMAVAASEAAFGSAQTTSSACTTSASFFSASRPARPTDTYWRNILAGRRASNCSHPHISHRTSPFLGNGDKECETYHLIDLLKRAIFDFWEEKEYPYTFRRQCVNQAQDPSQVREHSRCKPARRRPDVAILWSPVQSLRVDEVGRGECRKPGGEEADGCREAKGVRPKPLRG